MAQSSPKPVPGALGRELARRGLTQAKAEELTGLSRSVLAKVNRGESVSEKTLGRIGELLDAHPVRESIDTILGLGEGAMEPVPA